MAGLTPFQFSSNMLQSNTSLSKFTKTSQSFPGKSLLEDTFQTLASWYEMWVNPTKVSIQDRYIQNRMHTAGSIVTFHYRQDVKVMVVSGFIGWVQIQSDLDGLQNGLFNLLKGDTSQIKRSMSSAYSSFTNPQNRRQSNRRVTSSLSRTLPRVGMHGNKLNNSPRRFLQRLKDLADQPMYYYDSTGLEHYNVKYIKMYTKQFPTGVICEGYFTDFTVPETSDDSQTIQYDFTFIIENMKPITILQKLAGMFTGSTNVLGSAAGLF
jgi:hypothetical protein